MSAGFYTMKYYHFGTRRYDIDHAEYRYEGSFRFTNSWYWAWRDYLDLCNRVGAWG